VRTPRAVAAVAGLVLALSGCSVGAGGSAADSASAAGSSTEAVISAPSGSANAAAPAPHGPFGPGCAAMPSAGGGSFAGMAGVPVVIAASRNPLLTGLVGAVRAANLVESLDSQQEVTVLAPANAAFEAIPAGNRQALLADTAKLTALLTHHVIQGRVPPDQLVGTHTTLNNDQVTIAGSGQTLTVAAEGTVTRKPATVLCGNVQTANATVYIIDQVLAPTA
jgi:uncharacterized surface protein with fasciclin (FAS1) repeats